MWAESTFHINLCSLRTTTTKTVVLRCTASQKSWVLTSIDDECLALVEWLSRLKSWNGGQMKWFNCYPNTSPEKAIQQTAVHRIPRQGSCYGAPLLCLRFNILSHLDIFLSQKHRFSAECTGNTLLQASHYEKKCARFSNSIPLEDRTDCRL